MTDQNRELEALFLHRKPARMLVYIKQEKYPYASTLAKKIDATYAHTVKLLGKMHNFGLVKFDKEGRVKFVELTERGRDLADEFEILLYRRMAFETPKKEEKPVQEEQKAKKKPRK